MRYAVLIGSQLAVASAALFARWGLDEGVSPAALTAWRLTVASAVLLPGLYALRALRCLTPSLTLPPQGGGDTSGSSQAIRLQDARGRTAPPSSPAPWVGGGKGEGGNANAQTDRSETDTSGAGKGEGGNDNAQTDRSGTDTSSVGTAEGGSVPARTDLSGADTNGLPIRTALTLILAGAALALHFWAWFVSLQHIPVARSTLLVSTTPLWAGLGMWVVTRRRPPKAFWLGLAVSGVGAWLVTSAGVAQALQPGANTALGDGAAVLGAIGIAAYFLLVEPHQGILGTWRVVAWTYPSAAAATWLALGAAGSSSGVMPITAGAWGAIVALALVPQLIGHTALNWSLKHFTAGAVGAATLLEPVFAGFLAWLALGETPTLLQIAGAAVLLGGVALALRSGRSGR